MLDAIMLSVILMNVVILCVIKLNVPAPEVMSRCHLYLNDGDIDQDKLVNNGRVRTVKVSQKFPVGGAVRSQRLRSGLGTSQADDEGVVEPLEAVEGGVRWVFLVKRLNGDSKKYIFSNGLA
jgi:hypothetical protein